MRFASKFYKSVAWQKCRASFITKQQGLCQRCLSKGLIVVGTQVHHKIYLTPENINNPDVALNHDNLELLCLDCHHEEHNKVRYRVDESGHVEL